MSLIAELEDLGKTIGADVQRFVAAGTTKLEEHFAQDTQDPVERGLFAVLRTAQPILRIDGTVIVTRYADVKAVLADDGDFGVNYGETMRELAGDFILGLDDCTEYERDISILRLAAPRSDLPRLAAFITQTAERLVEDAFTSDGGINVADFTKQMPARLVGEWFGTPGPSYDELIAWSLPMFQDIFINLTRDERLHAAAMRAARPLEEYLTHAVADRKRATQRRDDVLGRLLAMQADPDTAFSDKQIVTNLVGLIVGAIPTITTAVTLALDLLLDRPEALAGAQAAALAGDVDGVRAFMWEAMRIAPIAPGLERVAIRDTVLGSDTMHATKIKAGETVLAATQSAMLDPAVIDDPDEFRAGRPAYSYLHFGGGMHQCFGRYVNAMQIPLIAMALLKRPGLRRAEGAAGALVKSGPYPQSLYVTAA